MQEHAPAAGQSSGHADPADNARGFHGRERLIVSPAAGVFAPLLDPAAVAGTPVRVGDAVGRITGPDGDVVVCSQFDGEMKELLAHPGERVRRHQPIGWLAALDDPRDRAIDEGAESDPTGIAGMVMTGANGFVGSHLLTAWMWANRRGRAACVVRGDSPAAARARLLEALGVAVADAALPVDVEDLVGDRLLVVNSELTDARHLADVMRPWVAGSTALNVLHVAADLSFKQADRPRVWKANVHGSAAMVDVAAMLGHPQVTFNHISTAYVCGSTQGVVPETLAHTAPGFANPYEESKFHAEELVRNSATAYGLPWRILRPSIVIGHSATLRASSDTGLYKVVSGLHALAQVLPPELRTVYLQLNGGSTIDLIPVDVVVDEALAVLAAGTTSTGEVFHLTADRPLPLAAIFDAATQAIGVHVVAGEPPPDERVANLARTVSRRMRHYWPYLQSNRRFERGNVDRYVDHEGRQLTVERVVDFVEAYTRTLDSAVTLGVTA